MEEILKTILLEYEKSTFLLDLIKHKSGNKYIKITQTINNGESVSEIKINPTILTDLIIILQQFKNEFDNNIIANSSLYFSDEKQKAIVERYFKGISIQDLALQFNCSNEIVTQILLNKGIEIVDNSLPKIKGKFRFKKKR